MIYLFANDKGGVGKTTCAVNMATLRNLAGRDVLLADCDLQRTATNWCAIRSQKQELPSFSRVQLTGMDVGIELARLADRYQDVIVDTHGADSVEMRQAMTVADVVVMPLQMSQFDLWGVSRVLEVKKNIEATWNDGQTIDLRALINCAHPKAKKDKAEMRAALEGAGLYVMQTEIHWRVAYARMTGTGTAIVETDKGRGAKTEAGREMKEIYKEIFGQDWSAVAL